MFTILDVLSGRDKSIRAKLFRFLAWPASKPYSLVMTVRNRAYDRGWIQIHRVNVPVIAIGNLTVGGTGKTPAVAMVCRQLRAESVRVAIISRGYGAADGQRNDEAMELELRLPDVPHVQNRDRLAAATLAIEELDCQAIVMDDGFQHRRLHRDLDIVLLDATQPFGFGHLLPRGLLRESVSSLRRASVVIVTRADQVDQQRLAELRTLVQRYTPRCVWAEAVHKPAQLRNSAGQVEDLQKVIGADCFLFSAIGNPAAFEHTVRQAGGNIVEHQRFADHHRFSADDMQQLQSAMSNAKAKNAGRDLLVLCTGKDLAKVNVTQIANCPVYALEIDLELVFGSEAFNERLLSTLADFKPLKAAESAQSEA